MKSRTQIKRTEWVGIEGRYGWDNAPLSITHYRLWLETDGRRWWQRHEWKYSDETTWLDEWIDSINHKEFPTHYKDVIENA